MLTIRRCAPFGVLLVPAVLLVITCESAVVIGQDAEWRVPMLDAEIMAETEAIRKEASSTSSTAASMLKVRQELAADIRTSGLNDGNRLILEERRRNLPSLTALRNRLSWSQTMMHRVNLAGLSMEQIQEDPDGSIKNRASSLRQLSLELGNLAAACQNLIRETTTTSDFLDSNLLWVASSESLGSRDFASAMEGAGKLVRAGPWVELWSLLAGRMKGNPWQVFALLGGILLLGVMAKRFESEAVVEIAPEEPVVGE